MKTVVGMMLVDAPHSALNNAGMQPGERTENIVRTKTIKKGNKTYPYVSGQAFRYWWRETLQSKFGWNMSPLEREQKIVYSEADPLEYPDDDVFGYMRAPKGRGSETVTRASPLKVSPLISVLPQKPEQDYGVAARHEGDPVPYEHEFYSTVFKGIFSLEIDRVGVLTSENRTGYKNITEKLEEKLKESEAVQKEEREDGKEDWVLPLDVRKSRITHTIKALPYLFGGAMSATHLTDVTPKFLVLALLNGGNHIFMNLVGEKEGQVDVSLDALLEVASDYRDQILTPIYLGKRKGFMDELEPEIKSKLLENQNTIDVIYESINSTTEKFATKISNFIE